MVTVLLLLHLQVLEEEFFSVKNGRNRFSKITIPKQKHEIRKAKNTKFKREAGKTGLSENGDRFY